MEKFYSSSKIETEHNKRKQETDTETELNKRKIEKPRERLPENDETVVQGTTTSERELDTETEQTEEISQWAEVWRYSGHGEWEFTEDLLNKAEAKKAPEQMTNWEMIKARTNNEHLMRHFLVMKHGYPNRYGARVEIPTQWNLEKFTQKLEGYHDKEIIEWLRFGWPSGRLPTLPELQHTYCITITKEQMIILRHWIST